jgi:hypothetical protein
MDGSDQTAQWIDFKFADNVDHTPIYNVGLNEENIRFSSNLDAFCRLDGA